ISDDSDKKSCKATVPDGQLSLAIGNKGQNARLAARLTGWKIDIRPESGFYGEDEDEEEETVAEEAAEEAVETEAVEAETETAETEEPETEADEAEE
ncbi:MAG: transcription termination/antitermination protein NusA, partial [Oscillospiraceae bacterium]|nr:transcription termination/antitermination protein NusA [Oscillospiraceae bacterium]